MVAFYGLIEREKHTVEIMLGIYCHGHHEIKKGLCPQCSELLGYSNNRLDECQFGEDKPVCSNCSVHCYEPEVREKIKEVMRYAGPRMAHRHPILATRYFMDARKQEPSADCEDNKNL